MKYDVIVIGAGAAGLFAGFNIAKSGKKVLLLDNGKKAGRKILISGGGYCNFTNLEISHGNYLSDNPHFVKSAISRYTQWDFLALIKQYNIGYHEKELGQLFTNNGAKEIVNMLLTECKLHSVKIELKQNVADVIKQDDVFHVITDTHKYITTYLVIATGGLALKELGGSTFGYKVAEKFKIKVFPIFPSLVPFTWQEKDMEYTILKGISLHATVSNLAGISFSNNILFTHKGLSGPAILQISNYWQQGEAILINLLPNNDILAVLKQAKISQSKSLLKAILSKFLPKAFIDLWIDKKILPNLAINQISDKKLQNIANNLHNWQIIPNSTEGYKKAEVTRGGVDTSALSSKTMATIKDPNLYFIGEVVDVTGWLGGYNFQWAWSSAYACAQDIGNK